MATRAQFDTCEQASRIKFLVFLFLILGLIGVGRLFHLMILKNDYYAKIASAQHWAQDIIQPRRGKIFVRDEMTGGLYPLVGNESLNLVFASPEEIKDKETVSERLSPVIGVEQEKILSLLEDNRIYVVLARKLDHEITEKIKSFNLKGVYFSPDPVRYYPEETLASQVLGFVDGDGLGRYGIEEFFDDHLSGEPGLYKAEIDPSGKRIAFGDSVLKDAQDGSDLVLTINRDVQQKAEELISSTVDSFSAEGGSMIVMDPNSGAIIAMANTPTYNPGNYSDVDDYNLFKNSSVSDLFEPGSIFKIATMAAGLDSGQISPETEYFDKGELVLDGHKIMNSDRRAHGLVTITEILERSLNTGTAYAMQQIGRTTFFEYLKKFGFGKITGIEQPAESSGVVHRPDEVNDHTYATMAFGQSITTTPIQIISAFATVANGGNLVKPYLVEEIINSDETVIKTDQKSSDHNIISREAVAKLKKMMIGVVDRGHGRRASVDGYKIAGKTGTAQVPRENGLGYDPNKSIGSFVGFGPAEDPKFVVLAKVDSPEGVRWAEETAAPAVGEMLDFLFKYYQVPPTE